MLHAGVQTTLRGIHCLTWPLAFCSRIEASLSSLPDDGWKVVSSVLAVSSIMPCATSTSCEYFV